MKVRMTKSEFLRANPEIRKYMKNDTSLKYICPAEELKNLDYTRLSRRLLCTVNEYDYKPRAYNVENYKKLFLKMIINGKTSYTIKYKEGFYSKKEVELMMENIRTAYQHMSEKYIGYFGVIAGIEISYSYGYIKGRMKEGLTDIAIHIKLKENYRGAIKEIDRYTRLCGYVIDQLREKGKITSKMSKYEVAKVLYNWVVLHIKYDRKLEKSSQTGMRGLIEGTCVCNGYTALFNSLCALCRIESYTITGIAGKTRKSGEPHIWSYIKINGKNVFIDATWGSVEYAIRDKSERDELRALFKKFNIDTSLFCNFDYFDMPKFKMDEEHFYDKKKYRL